MDEVSCEHSQETNDRIASAFAEVNLNSESDREIIKSLFHKCNHQGDNSFWLLTDGRLVFLNCGPHEALAKVGFVVPKRTLSETVHKVTSDGRVLDSTYDKKTDEYYVDGEWTRENFDPRAILMQQTHAVALHLDPPMQMEGDGRSSKLNNMFLDIGCPPSPEQISTLTKIFAICYRGQDVISGDLDKDGNYVEFEVPRKPMRVILWTHKNGSALDKNVQEWVGDVVEICDIPYFKKLLPGKCIRYY